MKKEIGVTVERNIVCEEYIRRITTVRLPPDPDPTRRRRAARISLPGRPTRWH